MPNHNGFICGGVFKSIFEGKPFKDIDIFFKNKADFDEAIKLFTADNQYVKLYENKSATCFKNVSKHYKVDLVCSVFGTPEEIISNFDFTITKFAYFKKEVENSIEYTCLMHKDFFEHLLLKKLVIDDKLPFPIGTFERAFRYNKYGFGLCRVSKAKLIESLQGQNTDNLSRDLYFGFD
jgi:hypothetical protein